VELEQTPSALFAKRVVEEGLATVRVDDWSTSERTLAGLGDVLLRVGAPGREHVLLERDGTLVQVGFWSGHVHATVADRDEGRVGSTLVWLRERLPAPDPSSTHEISVTFWTYGPHGPMPTWRSISVPAWADIGDNYAASTRAGLEPLMEGFEPARGGQLLLWHGTAGTGKTFGLRALGWEWRDWCEFHYIVDPDTFFGQHADYLMNVLLQPTFDAGWAAAMDEMGEVGQASIGMSASMVVAGDGERRPREKGWKLLMLEDTGELLTADARAVIGQGLSRFLNVVDGLIGQGLRVLVLVTTNEEIRTLHPAVARPGRCAANVEFLPLSVEEASRWLSRNEVDATVSRATTLASLYALAEGLEPGGTTRTTGFAG
jgi:hypothetical protein